MRSAGRRGSKLAGKWHRLQSSLIGVLSLVSLVAGCTLQDGGPWSKDASELDDAMVAVGPEWGVLQSKVIVLVKDDGVEVVDRQDNGALVLAVGNEEMASLIVPGCILYSDYHELALFAKVLSVSWDGSMLTAKTEVPQFHEVFSEAHLDRAFELDFSNAILTGELAESVTFSSGGKSDDDALNSITIPLNRHFSWQMSAGEYSSCGKGTIELEISSGHLTLTPSMLLEIDKSKEETLPKKLTLAFNTQVNLHLEVTILAEGSAYDCSVEKSIPIGVTIPVAIPFFYAEVGTALDWRAVLDFEGSIVASGGMDVQYTATVGATYQDGEWSAIKSVTDKQFEKSGPELEALAAFGIRTGPKVSLTADFYAVAEAAFFLFPFVGVEAQANVTEVVKLLWKMLVGVDAGCEFRLHVLFFDLLKYEKSWRLWEYVLGEGQFTISDVPCEADCSATECGLAPNCPETSCGLCPQDMICINGQCLCIDQDHADCCKNGSDVCWYDSCDEEQEVWKQCPDGCEDGNCLECQPGCFGKDCGPDGCGGICGDCVEPGGIEFACIEGVCECMPNCNGKACGDDGCEGLCGTCADGYVCETAGDTSLCGPDCTALCEDKECGDAGLEAECLCGACDDANECTTDSCDAFWKCNYASNSAFCDDGNPCTVDDTCMGGDCVGTLLPLSEALADGCTCESDSDCEPLDDGNICNGHLVCNTGLDVPVCILDAGSVLDCTDDSPCILAACDPVSGCSFPEAPDGTQCPGGPQNQCLNGQCVCVPDCQGKECGPDGCGGSCGECPGPQDFCMNDQCQCLPNCVGKQCGPDGCKGVCGECDDGFWCTDDDCKSGTCAFHLHNACKIGGQCYAPSDVKPADPCLECDPDDSTISWSSVVDGTTCGPGTAVCFQGSCCSASCSGKDCGGDGCGGTCGGCVPPLLCKGFNCVCPNNQVACGETCCPGGQTCKQGGCCQPETCSSLDKECGPGYLDGCGGILNCGQCNKHPNSYCSSGSCKCNPSCAGKECGDDGCGGNCGACGCGEQCIGDSCHFTACSGKECGSNGCGGVCGDGTCPPGKSCKNGNCTCLPKCAGKQCGPDACGGSCGNCPGGTVCKTGTGKCGKPSACGGYTFSVPGNESCDDLDCDNPVCLVKVSLGTKTFGNSKMQECICTALCDSDVDPNDCSGMAVYMNKCGFECDTEWGTKQFPGKCFPVSDYAFGCSPL